MEKIFQELDYPQTPMGELTLPRRVLRVHLITLPNPLLDCDSASTFHVAGFAN